jgi:hypothetical protein
MMSEDLLRHGGHATSLIDDVVEYPAHARDSDPKEKLLSDAGAGEMSRGQILKAAAGIPVSRFRGLLRKPACSAYPSTRCVNTLPG